MSNDMPDIPLVFKSSRLILPPGVVMANPNLRSISTNGFKLTQVPVRQRRAATSTLNVVRDIGTITNPVAGGASGAEATLTVNTLLAFCLK